MVWEGVARQQSIEHIPRSRTRGSSLSSTGPSANSVIPGAAFGRTPTALSAISIPEEGDRRRVPLASPVVRSVSKDASNEKTVHHDAATGTHLNLSHSDSSSGTLADTQIGNQRKASGVDGLAFDMEEAKIADQKEVDLEKRGNAAVDKEQSGETLGQRLSKRLTLGGRKKTEADFHDEFEIVLSENKHLDPHGMPEWRKWMLTALVGLLVLNATFASSAPANLIPSIITHFDVSQEVGVLTISMFVVGYCFGPLIWGPLSEQFGRRAIFLISFVPYVGFQVGCALSKNIGSLLVFRLLGGIFASSPLTNSGGVIADIFGPDRRGDALAIFSLMPFAGPAVAPVVAGALEVRGVSWRWIFWILTIFAGVCFGLILVILPETYLPTILQKEAARKRKETGDDRYWTASEHPGQKESLKDILDRTILKPFVMIAQEPMLLLLTIYMSFVYGIIYLEFEALPIVFGEAHGLNALQVGMTFIALPVGGVIACLIYILYFNRKYMALHRSMNGKMVPPEQRLLPIMYSAPLFAISFFWFGWTAYPSISIWSCILATSLLGASVLFVFLGIFNFLIDAYLASAASALAINTVFRSAFGAGFPLFATQMFRRLGTPGASSLLGGLAILFVPAPFVLYKYGRKFRAMSKNAKVLD